MDASAAPNRTPRASVTHDPFSDLVGAAAPAAASRGDRLPDDESVPPRPHAPPLRHDTNRNC